MRAGVARSYTRFVETITVRAKFEQVLGLTLPMPHTPHDTGYWIGESFVAARHLRTRGDSDTSQDFVDQYGRAGAFRVHANIAVAVEMISIGSVFLLLLLGVLG